MRHARELAERGLFDQALRLIDAHARPAKSMALQVLRAELCERTGNISGVNSTLESVERIGPLPPRLAARSHLLRSLVESQRGHRSAAVSSLQRAWSHAVAVGDLGLQCWTRLRAVSLTGHDACCWPDPQIAPRDLASDVAGVGQPSLVAAFHIFSAEQEIKRGSKEGSRRHELAAEAVLRESPNPWLEGLLALHRSCVAYFDADYSVAYRCACDALRSVRRSGHRRTRSLALANLAATYLAMGHLGRADVCIHEAIRSVTQEEQLHGLFLESQAEIKLAEGATAACRALLDAADDEARGFGQVRSDWFSHWTTATRIRLLQHEGRPTEALSLSRAAMSSLRSDGAPTTQRLKLAFVLALIDANHLEEAARTLAQLMVSAAARSPRAAAHMEFLHVYLESRGNPTSDQTQRFERALRLQADWGDSADLLLTSSRYLSASVVSSEAGSVCVTNTAGPRPARALRPIRTHTTLDALVPTAADDTAHSRRLISLLWTAAHGAQNVEVLAEEVVRILAGAGEIESACLLVHERDGTSSQVLTYASGASTPDTGNGQRLSIPIDQRNGTTYDFVLTASPNPVAQTGCLRLVDLVRRLLEASRPVDLHLGTTITDPDAGVTDNGVFVSRVMQDLFSQARVAARSRVTVLLTGETGTGKEVVARAIHALSGSKSNRFVPFNCSAVPRELVESQLFGYRRGSYTGAVDSSLGILRSTQGGTLFLDEIADLPLETQPKLLRFLDRGEVLPLGEVTPHTVSVHVIAAANANIDEMVHTGRFRADLYYRLAVIHLHIPPLRERRDDILPLARHFLRDFCRTHEREGVTLSSDLQNALLDYDWPGNVRELGNVINRLVVFARPDSLVTADMLPEHVRRFQAHSRIPPAQGPGYITVALDQPLQETLARVEQAVIERALLHSQGRATETAKRLGVSRKGLYLKRRKLGWTGGTN